MTIRWRLLQFGLIGVGMAMLLGGVGAWAINHLSDTMQVNIRMTTALRLSMDADMMHDALRADVLAAALAASEGNTNALRDAQNEVHTHGQRFREAMKQSHSLVSEPAMQARIDAVLPLVERYVDTAENFARNPQHNADAGANRLSEFMVQFGALEDAMEAVSESIEVAVKSSEQQAKHTVRLSWTSLAVGLIAALGVVILASLRLTGTIARPLEHAAAAADAIANGDLSRAIPESGSDETGRLLHSISTMQRNLKFMLDRLRNTSLHISESADALSGASENLAHAAQEQSEATSSVASAVEEMTVSIGQVAEHSSEAQAISTQSGERSAQGQRLIEEVRTDMASIEGSVKRFSRSVNELGEQSLQIRQIVHVIKDIADQTNLLALNAAIEAARAGEQGRGFAVVADEVRKLADRTSEATVQIGEMIDRVQKGVKAAVDGMEEGVILVERGSSRTREAGEAISQIDGSFARVLGAITDISAAMREQSGASTSIAGAVERIATMCEETSAAAANFEQTAKRLQGLAAELENHTGKFT